MKSSDEEGTMCSINVIGRGGGNILEWYLGQKWYDAQDRLRIDMVQDWVRTTMIIFGRQRVEYTLA